MALKIIIDYDACESNAVCMGIAPDIFEVREDDFLYVLKEEVPDDRIDDVQQAVDMCPKQAISFERV